MGYFKTIQTERPTSISWKNCKLFRADFYDARYPLCGTHLVWAAVGHKWVRIFKPIHNTRFKIRRSEWDAIRTCDMAAVNTKGAAQ